MRDDQLLINSRQKYLFLSIFVPQSRDYLIGINQNNDYEQDNK